MKKKLLVFILSLGMVMTLLSGCGQKESNSTFFQEAKKMSQIQTGTSSLELSAVSDTDTVTEAIPSELLSEDGKLDTKLKLESTVESETKWAVKISLKQGSDEYKEVTTVTLNEDTLYLNVAPLINTMKSIDAATASSLEEMLGQMGITESVSLNLKQISEVEGIHFPDIENGKALELVTGIFDKLDHHFKAIEGQDGDYYTLSVNEENADKAVDALIKFCESDLEQIYVDFLDYGKAIYKEDSVLGERYEKLKKDTSSIKEKIDGVKDNRDAIIRSIKNSKINAVAKISLSGKKGKREGTLSFDSGNITIGEGDNTVSGNFTINSEVKEGEAKIEDMIPENASDITTLLITYMTQLSNFY